MGSGLRIISAILFGGLMVISCGSGKNAALQKEVAPLLPAGTGVESHANDVAALPHVRLYKMRKDYSGNVAVTMNEARTQIVSYPDPVDIRPSVAPVPLGDGWYLDRRGVSANTVFTDYTFEQYAALGQVPSRETLMKHIIDKYPFTALWDCGTQESSAEHLKEIIRNGFRGCTPLYLAPPSL